MDLSGTELSYTNLATGLALAADNPTSYYRIDFPRSLLAGIE